jgi:putative transposase
VHQPGVVTWLITRNIKFDTTLGTRSYVKIWVHLVFTTKKRKPFLKKNVKNEVINHIIENCKSKNIFLKEINGHEEHIHCLISLGKEQSIAELTQLIKGESSFWVNKHKITDAKFNWQDDYFAVSISESQVGTVLRYIQNQEEHHKKKSFQEEVEEFVKKYGFKLIKDE